LVLAKTNKTKKEQRVILSKSTLTELTRIVGEGEVDFQIRTGENLVVFASGRTVLSSRVIEGSFPDFERIIPKDHKVEVNVDREEFVQAVKLASVFARESANIIKLKISKNAVVVSAESQKTGVQKTTLDAKVDGQGEKLEIAYNYRFLEDFLAGVEGEEVVMNFTNTASPGVFLDPADPGYLHLIMPVRLQE